MDWGIGDGLGDLIKGLFIVCCISVPLGIWKAIDLVVWASHHFSVSVH